MQILSVVKCRESVCLGTKISGDQWMTAKACKRKKWPRKVLFFKSKFLRLEAGIEKKCTMDNEERGAVENSRAPQGLWKTQEECQCTAKVSLYGEVLRPYKETMLPSISVLLILKTCITILKPSLGVQFKTHKDRGTLMA